MKIYTLWQSAEDGETMPWLVGAVDEYCIEENNGYPEEYQKQLDSKSGPMRELIIEIPEAAVEKLFISPVVDGKVK